MKEKRLRWAYILVALIFGLLFWDYPPLDNFVFGLFLCISLILYGWDK